LDNNLVAGPKKPALAGTLNTAMQVMQKIALMGVRMMLLIEKIDGQGRW